MKKTKKNTKTVKTKSSQTVRMNDMVDGLTHLLADTYVLYVKTQNFHWNVTGPLFYSFHKMFEEQYSELAEATDTIAERIRALMAPTPASMGEFLKLTSLEEADSDLAPEEMIDELLNDHELMAKNITVLFGVAQDAGDEVTLDMLIQRKEEHDKIAWMLRSTLGFK